MPSLTPDQRNKKVKLTNYNFFDNKILHELKTMLKRL